MVEYQLGAGVPQRTTVGSLWQAMSGRPLSADLLSWPPDLFALTSLLLQRSGAFRFALSPPPGRQWPPGSRSGWSTTVEAAGRAWSGVVDVPGAGHRVSGPGLPQRLRADPAIERASGCVHDQYLGLSIPSPALFDKIGQKFRRPGTCFAEANHIPRVKFAGDDRKADVMAQYLKQAAAGGRAHRWRRSRAGEFRTLGTVWCDRADRRTVRARTHLNSAWRTRRARV
jgi:hypothetical protein